MPRAGLGPASVTEAGAALADEVGFDQLSMGLLADRLGVRTPALYNHVTSQAHLVHRIAILAATELADAIREATQGRAGRDALAAGAQAMRMYVREHPGRYAAGNAARLTGPDDPLMAAAGRVIASWAAMLRGYRLDPDQEIHAAADAAQHAARIRDPGSSRRLPDRHICRRQLHLDDQLHRPRPAGHHRHSGPAAIVAR